MHVLQVHFFGNAPRSLSFFLIHDFFIEFWSYLFKMTDILGAFSTNSPGELDIFWHDRHAFRMNSAQVRVFKQAD